MVKQFTIPCQFGNDTSPVTLYIGHPEPTHHPVKFQSDWLSSAKGGTIPQDLMDTLQKLHDLASENGADFEELCYYALISATKHSSEGVSPDDIDKYANEFVAKEGNVETTSNNENKYNTKQETQQDNTIKDAEKVTSDENNTTDSSTNNQQHEKINPTLNVKQENNNDNYNDQSQASTQVFDENEDILKGFKDDDDDNNNNNSDNSTIDCDGGFSQEDEDLLLDDDLSTF